MARLSAMGKTCRPPRWTIALLVLGSLVTGCAAAGLPSYTAVPEMSGVRTADGDRQLVVTYVGGGCDKAARTRVIETATLVTVTAAIPTASGSCTSEGIPRVLTFRLPHPFGDRLVRNGLRGRELTVFDGTLLRTPTWIPAGYHEMVDFQRPSSNGSWSRSWRDPSISTAPDLTLTIGPHALPPANGTIVPGHYRVGRAPATVSRYAASQELSIQWTDPTTHEARELTTQRLTTSSTSLGLSILSRVADSVGP